MMWAELLFFVVVLGLLVHQLYSVKKAQRETAARDAAKNAKVVHQQGDPSKD